MAHKTGKKKAVHPVIEELRRERIAVVGLGISNRAAIRFLVAKGVKAITACDRKDRADLGDTFDELKGLGVDVSLGEKYLEGLDSYDRVVLAPGVPKDLPDLEKARAKGVPIDSEMGLFFRLCQAPISGITGSAGKTTTTTLVARMYEAAGVTTFLGGNIGQPLIEQVFEIPPEARVVLELSSFQLEMLESSPQHALYLNLAPNHLDLHGTMEAYWEAKAHIYRFQGPDDIAIFNRDCDALQQEVEAAPARVGFFSMRESVTEGAFFDGSHLLRASGGRAERVCHRSALKLLGEHNLSNALAAIALAGVGGVPVRAMSEALASFTGVEHRLELVDEVDGVRYYNDSIATAPDRAQAAIDTLEGAGTELTLIAGGYDKKLPFDDFARQVVQKVDRIILIGATATKIGAAIEAARSALLAGTGGNEGDGDTDLRLKEVLSCADLEEAVTAAKALAAEGSVVAMSPACASYDQFPNFEVRGQEFKRLVAALRD